MTLAPITRRPQIMYICVPATLIIMYSTFAGQTLYINTGLFISSIKLDLPWTSLSCNDVWCSFSLAETVDTHYVFDTFATYGAMVQAKVCNGSGIQHGTLYRIVDHRRTLRCDLECAYRRQIDTFPPSSQQSGSLARCSLAIDDPRRSRELLRSVGNSFS